MKRVLLTGASGRIGSRLGERLLKDGYEVVGLDLAPSRISDTRYVHVQTDFDDSGEIEQCFAEVDCVLHLGAIMSWHPKDRSAMFAANVAATQTILEAATDAEVRRFVFASSGEVYPEIAAEKLPITEEAPLNPLSFYGLTKKMGEQLVHFYQQQGLETVTLRFPHTQAASEILDPDSFFSGPRFFLDAKIRQMEYLGQTDIAEKLRALQGDGSPKMIVQHGEDDEKPYSIHIADVRDVVSGVLLAMTHPNAANEIFNLGPDDLVEFEHVLPRMAEITGLPLVNVFMPGQAIRYQTSNAKIKRLLGFQPRHTFMSMIEESGRNWGAGS